MQNVIIPATRQTPAIDLRFSEHRLRIAGEAYPENALSFFEPVLKAIADYLAQPHAAPLEVELELRYLNSASTKMVFKLAALLDQAAAKGRPVHMRFVVLEDDEILQELGADMKADLNWIDFEFVEVTL
jgi:hypothetical protein